MNEILPKKIFVITKGKVKRCKLQPTILPTISKTRRENRRGQWATRRQRIISGISPKILNPAEYYTHIYIYLLLRAENEVENEEFQTVEVGWLSNS